MWLTEKQIERLTGKSRPSAQIKVLTESGIAHKVVAGKPIVMESALNPTPLDSRPQLRLHRA